LSPIKTQQAVNCNEEANLVKQIANGREQALEHLYERYSKLLYSIIVAIVNTPEDAEEVLQEVFLQVWRKASTFDSQRGNVYRWLITLARNRAIDRTRSKNFSQHRELQRPLENPDRAPHPHDRSPLDAVVMLERAEMVRGVMKKISAEQKEVMHLAYFAGYTQSEIAKQLDLPLGTVKTRMRQAMIKLQTLIMQSL
jgi:RNA polymerase sigma-70 factor (ECF subfamily)